MKLYCYNGRIRPGTTHKLAPIYTQVYKTCPKRTKEKKSVRGELGEIQKALFCMSKSCKRYVRIRTCMYFPEVARYLLYFHWAAEI